MNDHPLALPPAHDPLLRRFLNDNRVDANRPIVEILTQVASAFARLPFENLTKILKNANASIDAEARRGPDEVLHDHWSHGTGGTCFSLTATMLRLVRGLGVQAEPILADRRYGPDTHSALLVWLDGKPHLLDPGYLIVKPLPIPAAGSLIVPTSFNQLVLSAGERDRIDLHTITNGQSTYRLTFKARPVDADVFLDAWDTSFEQDMMRYPVLSRVADGKQLYLQKNRILVRGEKQSQTRDIDPDQLVREIARHFGIAPHIVGAALDHLKRRGERHGSTANA